MNNSVNKNNILSSLIWKLLEGGGVQFLQIVIQILLARMLSPNEFGTMAVLLVFISLAQVFIDGGFSIALIQKKNTDELDYSSIFIFSLLISLLLYLLLFFLAPTISIFYQDIDLIIFLRILGLILFPGALNTVQYAYVSKNLLFKKSAISSLFSTLISGIIGIISALNGLGIWALIAQRISYSIINSLFLLIILKWQPKFIFSLSRVRKLFSYGGNILASNLLFRFYLELRTLLIGRFYDSSLLGFYHRGDQMPRVLVNGVDGAIQSVILPSLSVFQDDSQKIKKIVRRSVKTSTYIIFPILFGLAAVSHNFTYVVLGEQWLPSVPYLIIFCFAHSLTPVHGISQQPARAMGRSDIIFKTEIIKRIIGMVLIVITLPFGIIAIAIGFLFEKILEVFINAYPNNFLISYSFKELLNDISSSFFQALLMGIVVYIFNFLNISLILKLFIQIAIGGILYILLSIIFKNESMYYLIDTIKNKND